MAGTGVARKKSKPLNPIGLIGVLTMLAKTNELYYLHPSFGYYFEQFYQEPHGLAYKLKTLPGRHAPAAVAGQKSNRREPGILGAGGNAGVRSH